MRRLLPAAGGRPADLDESALAEAYAVPAGRPWHVRLNFVTSADGGVTVDDRSGGLSNPADKLVFGLLRDLADVVLVGAGTVRAERYRAAAEQYGPERRQRRIQLGRAELPVIAVISSALDLDPASTLFTRADPGSRTVLVTCQSAPETRRKALAEVADIVVAGDERVDLPTAVSELATRGLTRMLCEGGPTLFGALLGASLVDELCLTVSPLLTGPGAGRIVAGPLLGATPYPMTLLHVLEQDGALLLRYALPVP